MLRKSLTYFAGLVALYIAVSNAPGLTQLITSGSQGATGLTRTLQGR